MSGMPTSQKQPDGLTPVKKNKSIPSFTTHQKIVYVKVGNQKQPFRIHLELACFHSSYLKAAFTGGFPEAITCEIVLENTLPELFGLFIHWMYAQDIPTTICDDMSLPVAKRDEQELPSMVHLFELWLLADYLQVPKLQNKVLDTIRRRIARIKYYQLPALRIPFEKTLQGSVVRKLVIDLLCWSSIPAKNIFECRAMIPSEMFIELFVAERNRRMALNPKNPLEDMSNYYVGSSHK